MGQGGGGYLYTCEHNYKHTQAHTPSHTHTHTHTLERNHADISALIQYTCVPDLYDLINIDCIEINEKI